jgi:Secretion system C-terminal sorting domain/PKD-like domain
MVLENKKYHLNIIYYFLLKQHLMQQKKYKNLLFQALFVCFTFMSFLKLNGQTLAGSNIVCGGYNYTYTLDTAGTGADRFDWLYPNGWVETTSQGSPSLTVMVNQNVGDICVEAWNQNNFVGVYCLTTTWGTGQFNVTSSSAFLCDNGSVDIFASGSGSCGNGSLSFTVHNHIYRGRYPNGTLIGSMGGGGTVFTLASQLLTPPLMPPGDTFFVYPFDNRNAGNPVLIEGGGISGQNWVFIGVAPTVPIPIVGPIEICGNLVGTPTFSIDPSVANLYTNISWQGNGSMSVAGSSTNASANYQYLGPAFPPYPSVGVDVIANDIFGCMAFGSYSPTVILCMSTNEAPTSKISISPNPVIVMMKIDAEKPILLVSIFNCLGQLVFEKEFNNEQAILSVSDLSKGIYQAKITLSNQSVSTLTFMK